MARARGNGTGSVTPYKDSKGKKKYRVRVTAGVVYDEEKGKFKYTSKSLGVYNTKAEAEKVLAEYNESPYDLSNKVKTVKDLYDEWSVQYFSNIAPSAVRSVKSAWAYCEDIYNLPLQKLGRGHIERVMHEGKREIIRGSKVETRKASINTQLRIKSMFNLMLDYAVSYRLIQTNWARSFDVKDMRKQADYQKKIKQPFTNEELKLIWDNLNDFLVADMILIQCYMSWRPVEVSDLLVENVHLDESYIQGGCKTEAGTMRKVPIHPLVRPLVEKRLEQAEKLNSKWLFNDRFSQTGNHITIDKYRHRFETMMNYLGIKGRTMHCGRVTFITKAYNAGIPEYKIKRIAGHSLKGNVTDGVYNRVSIADLYQAVSTIPQYIPDSSENLKTDTIPSSLVDEN